MHEIKNRWTGAVIFTSKDSETLLHALERAVEEKVNLDGASLVGANLVGANLDGASLVGANLDGAYLVGANLVGANLDGASLVGANLVRANLDGASLVGANLDGASLDSIRNDFWDVLIRARHEIPELRKHLVEGKVDGSVYEGECACLVGTIANIKHCKYDEIKALKPDSTRPIECFFMGIKTGDTPETNQISKIVVGWIDEFESLLK